MVGAAFADALSAPRAKAGSFAAAFALGFEVADACGVASSSPRAKAGSFAAAFALGFEVPPRTPSFGVARQIALALRRERGLASARGRPVLHHGYVCWATQHKPATGNESAVRASRPRGMAKG